MADSPAHRSDRDTSIEELSDLGVAQAVELHRVGDTGLAAHATERTLSRFDGHQWTDPSGAPENTNASSARPAPQASARSAMAAR